MTVGRAHARPTVVPGTGGRTGHLPCAAHTPFGLRKRGPGRIREGVRVVGTYVHAYDPTTRRPQYPTPIPAMRGTHESAGGRSATPIYDALYSEYRRSFRALPGDRSGEENLTYSSFGVGPYGMHHSAGRHTSAYHEPQHVHSSPPSGSWHTNGRQHSTGSNLPAALPPGPRRER